MRICLGAQRFQQFASFSILIVFRTVTPFRSCGGDLARRSDQPKLDFLDCCKAIAKRAGLDPENFWLDKFRATCATWSLWAGVDLRTVQHWLGHSDMESTMRYLKPSRASRFVTRWMRFSRSQGFGSNRLQQLTSTSGLLCAAEVH